SPTMVNDFRASYYRYAQKTDSISYMQDYAGQLGIAGLPKDAMPGIWPGGFTESIQVTNPNTNIQEIFTVKDDVSKMKGTHSFKWGYELMRYRQNSYGINNPDGTFNYAG